MLGGGLTTIVVDLRKALDTVVDFKNEISAAGEILFYAFGAKAATMIMSGVVSGFRSAATEVRLVGVAFEVMSEKMRVANLMNSTMMMGAPMMSGWSAGVQHRRRGHRVPRHRRHHHRSVADDPRPGNRLRGRVFRAVPQQGRGGLPVSLEKFGARTREEAKAVDIYVAQLDKPDQRRWSG